MHGSVPGSPLTSTQPSTPAVSKSGYLFERRGGRVLQSWVRKYFIIDGEELKCTYRGPKVCRLYSFKIYKFNSSFMLCILIDQRD